MKSHAKKIDIQRGRTTVEDKSGNDGADSLAVSGTILHLVLAEVVEAAQARKKHARSAHQMSVSILQARFAAEQAQHDTDGADRHSDAEGDHAEDLHCMELLNDDFDRGGDILSDVL